jgi:hypothetical protein
LDVIEPWGQAGGADPLRTPVQIDVVLAGVEVEVYAGTGGIRGENTPADLRQRGKLQGEEGGGCEDRL